MPAIELFEATGKRDWLTEVQRREKERGRDRQTDSDRIKTKETSALKDKRLQIEPSQYIFFIKGTKKRRLKVLIGKATLDTPPNTKSIRELLFCLKEAVNRNHLYRILWAEEELPELFETVSADGLWPCPVN